MKTLLLLLLVVSSFAWGAVLSTLCADRAAIERVYHEHRTGTKPHFEQAMPTTLLETLVRTDLKKEAVLRRVYGVEITDAMVAAEVQRIDATTRAPEMLAEIKHALGDDAARFARSMARPIVVERLLRQRFDNDDALHAANRRETEQARAKWLAKETVAGAHEVTWQLTPRPEAEKSEIRGQKSAASAAPVKSDAKSASYSVEATTQIAQVLTSPAPAAHDKEKFYFEDLGPQLQNVLRTQLQKPGDVSAVIELPTAFLVFQCKEKATAILSASSLTIPKRSYEEWLAQQPEP